MDVLTLSLFLRPILTVFFHKTGETGDIKTYKTKCKIIPLSFQLSEKEENSVICVIYHHEQNYSKLRLECLEDRVSKEICAKVRYLIDERSSEAVQTEYKAYRERKLHRRKTIHF